MKGGCYEHPPRPYGHLELTNEQHPPGFGAMPLLIHDRGGRAGPTVPSEGWLRRSRIHAETKSREALTGLT